MPLAPDKRNVIFRMSYCCSEVWTHFWPFRKHEKTHVQSPKNCIVERALLIRPATRPKVLKQMFFGCPTKIVASSFHTFVAVVFIVIENPRRPSDPSSSHPKNNVFFGSMCGSSGTKLNSQKTKKNWVPSFLWSLQKTFDSKFLVEPFWVPAPKLCFSKIEILEFIPCARDAHSWRAATRL